MPDLVMHYYYANELFKKLPKDVQNKIANKNLYVFASAGPDPFFFYKFYKFKENKKVADLGHYMHKNKIFEFFERLTHLTEGSLKEQNLLFSYLSGFIAHHTLDSLIHPYVFYKTGLYDKNDATTDIYRGLHTKLERAMDAYIIREYYRQKPHRFDIVCEVLNLKEIPISLEEPLDELYRLFDINNGYCLVNDSVIWQRKFYKFINDPLGIKNFFFKIIDSKKMPVALTYLSYYKKEIHDIDILNLNKSTWANPSDESIVSNLSVLELIDLALTKGENIIKELYNYIYLNNKVDLVSILPKTSYLDGLGKEHSNMRFFKNIFEK